MPKSSKTRDGGFSGLNVEPRAVDSLKPYSRNARTHSEKQICQVADSIRTFGFTNPILIDADGDIVAGHARVEAAKRLGLEIVPTICLDYMTEEQKRAYVLADNKLAANAGWDQELLALELQYLSQIELDFDITIAGFETAEIDILIDGLRPDPDLDADKIPCPDPATATVNRPGDLWHLGRHRLLCGDATEPASFVKLMGRKKAQMVFTDPPFNVAVDGHVSGLGREKHYFGRERLLTLVFENATREPIKAQKQVSEFLGIQADRFPRGAGASEVNAGAQPRFPQLFRMASNIRALLQRYDQDWLVNLGRDIGVKRVLIGKRQGRTRMAPETREKLDTLYRAEIDRLETLLSLDFAVWKRHANRRDVSDLTGPAAGDDAVVVSQALMWNNKSA